jgi:hypothetical protein
VKRRFKLLAIPVVSLLGIGGAAFVPVGGESVAEATTRAEKSVMDLSAYSATAPEERLDLVFLHHSVGSQLLSPTSDDPLHGGGLRGLLEANRYVVHEATYGSTLGESTDLFDWLPKFRNHMADVLAIDDQNRRLAAPTRNRVVLFKSCFPNNDFVGEGTEPGNPAGPELTVANAKATLRAVRDELAKQPSVLFVYLTAPPRAPRTWPEALWKRGVRKVMGKPTSAERLAQSAALASSFNRWVTSPDGWLAGYERKNVVVFDLFAVLSEGGSLLRYPTGEGRDSHPSSEGSKKAAALLVPFLNQAVRRSGIAPES